MPMKISRPVEGNHPAKRQIPVPSTTGDPVVLFTLGRSGTHLVLDILRHQFRAFSAWKWPGEPAHHLYFVPEHVTDSHCSPGRVARVLGHSRRPIVLTHCWDRVLPTLAATQSEIAAWLANRASVIFIVRDPRYVFPKMFAMLSMHYEELGGRGVMPDPDTFIVQQAQHWVIHTDAIASTPRALTLHFETLLADPSGQIARLGAFLTETPRMREPLLIPPRRTLVNRVTSRLHPRPLSSHVILRKRAQAAFPLDWTPHRLGLLDEIAGKAMELMGYGRPTKCDSVRAG